MAIGTVVDHLLRRRRLRQSCSRCSNCFSEALIGSECKKSHFPSRFQTLLVVHDVFEDGWVINGRALVRPPYADHAGDSHCLLATQAILASITTVGTLEYKTAISRVLLQRDNIRGWRNDCRGSPKVCKRRYEGRDEGRGTELTSPRQWRLPAAWSVGLAD
jgi:hypothetical protein